MKALLFERSLPRFAAARVVSGWRSGTGAWVGPLRLAEIDEPDLPGAGWVRVRTRLSGICGSDLATIDGRSSRYFEPIVSFPFVPGHEVVGDRADGADGGGGRVVLEPVLRCAARGIVPPCDSCARGETNRCRNVAFGHVKPGLQTGFCAETGGGWGQEFVAHESQLHAVPDGLSDEAAVMVEPAACAVHGALLGSTGERGGSSRGSRGSRSAGSAGDPGVTAGTGAKARAGAGARAGARAGAGSTAGAGATAAEATAGAGATTNGAAGHNTAVVLGAGTLGLCTVAAIRRLRSDIDTLLVVAKHPEQRRLAQQLGTCSVVEPDEMARAVRRRTGSLVLDSGQLTGGATLVFDCVGTSASLASALSVVGPGGTVVLLGMPGEVKVDLTGLWQREVSITGAYAYGTERPSGGRSKPRRTFDLAFELVADAGLERLVSARYPLERYREAIEHAAHAGSRGATKIAFDLRRKARFRSQEKSL